MESKPDYLKTSYEAPRTVYTFGDEEQKQATSNGDEPYIIEEETKQA